MLNKRLIILIAIISGILIITGIALWLLFRTPASQAPVIQIPLSEDLTTTPITPPAEGRFSIFKLSDVAAISPAISGNKVLYYSKLNGNALEADFEGNSTNIVTSINIPGIITTLWSSDRSQAINVYQENNAVKKVLFDFPTKKATLLDSRIKFVNFSAIQNKIAYQFVDNSLGTNKIVVADSNGLNYKSVFDVRMDDLRVYWPREDKVAFSTAPSGIVQGTTFVKTIGEQSSGLTKIISDAFGLTIKYSPDGTMLLYSQTDQFGHSPTLYLIKNGGIAENLSLNSLSDKCAFSNQNSVYCAIPSVINGSLVLPDDFYKNIADFSDVFFKIDIVGKKNFIVMNPADLKYDFNVSDLIISPNEDYLIFINKKDGLLYSVKIK